VAAFTLFQILNPQYYTYAILRIPFGWAIAIGAMAGCGGGLLFFILFSWLYFKVGKLLKGKGTFREVRASYAWSMPPWFLGQLFLAISAIPIWLNILSGTSNDVGIQGETNHLLWTLAGYASHVFFFWSFVLSLFTISLAHRFSMWKSFLTFALICLGIILLALSAGLLIGIFLHFFK
jgi:hypothetical protein